MERKDADDSDDDSDEEKEGRLTPENVEEANDSDEEETPESAEEDDGDDGDNGDNGDEDDTKLPNENQCYINIKRDLSDLETTIKWCLKHDKICKAIAQNALHFSEKYICKKGIFEYLNTIIQ